LDRVDIIVSHGLNEGEENEETNEDDEPVTELFMSDVPVHKVFQGEEGQNGIAVEVKAEDAPRLIHMQNYADYIRVLKAGAGDDESDEVLETDGQKSDSDGELDEDEEQSEDETSEEKEEEQNKENQKDEEEKESEDKKD